MRLKYYKLTLRQMSLKKPFVFFIIVLVTMLISTIIINMSLKPTIKILCETSAKNLALRCTNKSIEANIEGLTYEDLVSFQTDINGKIIALKANVIEINKLTSKISTSISNELSYNQQGEIQVPLGSFLGMKLMGGFGPGIKIKTIPTGDISVNFKSQFESAGINQTRHTIYVEIVTKVKVLAPFYTEDQVYVDDITVAETILVGDTPSQYYNISGMDVKEGLDIAK